MLNNALTYVAVLVVFLALDAVYLTLVGAPLFRAELGSLITDKMRAAPAVAFYLLYIVGVMVLCVVPSLTAGGWTRAALFGAVLGLTAYGAYDLTNMATLTVWSPKLTVTDMAWGAIATGLASTAGFWASRALARIL